MNRLSAHPAVAVLGTVCCDEVRTADRETRRALGGLYYNVAVLGQLFEKNGIIYPVCRVGSEDYSEIAAALSGSGQVDLSYVQKYPGRNNRVILDYYTDSERVEYSSCLPEPYVLDELLPVPEADLYMVNFVSGIEMNYRTLRALRRRLKVPL